MCGDRGGVRYFLIGERRGGRGGKLIVVFLLLAVRSFLSHGGRKEGCILKVDFVFLFLAVRSFLSLRGRGMVYTKS